MPPFPPPHNPVPGSRGLGAGIPTSEEQDQQALFQWLALAQRQRPELKLLYHVPLGGHRHKAVAAKLKAGGVKPGVPDIHLPVAKGEYHGLWIELKAGKNRPTDNQRWWIERLRQEGHRVEVCYGWQAAKAVIEEYLTRPDTPKCGLFNCRCLEDRHVQNNDLENSGRIVPIPQKELIALRARIAESERHLGNLLAIIHGDGGHYQGKHGAAKAVEDAIDLSILRIQYGERVQELEKQLIDNAELKAAGLRAILRASQIELDKTINQRDKLKEVLEEVVSRHDKECPADNGQGCEDCDLMLKARAALEDCNGSNR